MKIIKGSAGITTPVRKPVVTMGNFDGVHRGHQRIFSIVVERARALNGTPVVYTFDPHPAIVLAPDRSIDLLQTQTQREATIAECGIEIAIIEPFTKQFAHMSSSEFLESILFKRMRPAQIIVGYDFTFGAHRMGRTEHLKEMGGENGIPVEVVEPVFRGDVLISSTYIRQCVKAGKVYDTAELLGRAYSIEGKIVRGRGIGRQLGFPTVNLLPENRLIPPEGVYVSSAQIQKKDYTAATYIGRRPTFGGESVVVETYLLDFSGEITANEMSVSFHERLRGDVHFDTPEALRKQIARDIEAARKFHEGDPKGSRHHRPPT